MRTPEAAGINNEAHVLHEWTELAGMQGEDPPPGIGRCLEPGVSGDRSRASAAGGRAPPHHLPRPRAGSRVGAPSAPLPPGTPGPPHAQQRVSPPGSKALLEAPGPEARVPGSSAPGGARSRCSAPGCFSGSSVVVPSLAEQDPKEQQDRGCEAHPDEILHRVVCDHERQGLTGL